MFIIGFIFIKYFDKDTIKQISVKGSIYIFIKPFYI